MKTIFSRTTELLNHFICLYWYSNYEIIYFDSS